MRAIEATFVFTDIEGSTRLWLENPESALDALELHDRLIGEAFEASGGEVRKNTGDGLLAVFPEPQDAVMGALEAQRRLAGNASALGIAANVRMAIHLGVANVRNGDLFGLDIHLCQRIMSEASGGQVFLSEPTARELVERLPPSVRLVDLGRRRLKGIADPQEVYFLVSPGLRDVPRDLARPESGNLPVDADSFIGRQSECDALTGLLAGSRVVTLTGEGGVGKSRLALELARRVGSGFADGAWLVSLDQVGDDGAVPRVIADQIDAPVGTETTEALVQHLATRELLLVLDGCERVLSGVDHIVEELMRRTPGCKIVATSRQRIGVGGETLFRVGPLPVPEDGVGMPAALDFDAVLLFSARAGSASSTFRLDARNVRDVVAICRQMDGLPIALEVAAARVSSMTPREIANRLIAVEGQSPVEGVLAWSLDLLTSDEREVFRRGSVFRSPFDVEAAEAVIARPAVFRDLITLVEKSLLRRLENGRFRVLAPIREFAARQLEASGETEEVTERHARHFAARADAFAERGPRVGDRIGAIAEVADDLRVAHDHAVQAGDGALALRLAIGTAPLWKQRGHGTEGLARLEAALRLVGPADLMASGHMHAGDLAIDVGRFGDAEEHLELALDSAGASGDASFRAWALARLAAIPHKRGEIQEAIVRFEAAAQAARDAGDELVLAHVLASLSLLHCDKGNRETAAELADEAVAAAVTSGDPYAMADVLLTVGELELENGDAVTARIRFREAMMLAEQVGMQDVTAWALSYLGRTALVAGDPREAAVFSGEGRDAFEQGGLPLGRPWAVRHLAIAQWQLGHRTEALALLDEALEDARRFVKPEALMLAEARAWIRASTDPTAAARDLGATAAIAADMGLVYHSWEKQSRRTALDSIQDSIGADALEAALAAGQELRLTDL